MSEPRNLPSGDPTSSTSQPTTRDRCRWASPGTKCGTSSATGNGHHASHRLRASATAQRAQSRRASTVAMTHKLIGEGERTHIRLIVEGHIGRAAWLVGLLGEFALRRDLHRGLPAPQVPAARHRGPAGWRVVTISLVRWSPTPPPWTSSRSPTSTPKPSDPDLRAFEDRRPGGSETLPLDDQRRSRHTSENALSRTWRTTRGRGWAWISCEWTCGCQRFGQLRGSGWPGWCQRP